MDFPQQTNIRKRTPGKLATTTYVGEVVDAIARTGPVPRIGNGEGKPPWPEAMQAIQIVGHLSGEGTYSVIIGRPKIDVAFDPATDDASFAFHAFDTLKSGETYNAVFVNKAEEGKGGHWLDAGGHYFAWLHATGRTSDGYLLLVGHTFDTQLCESEEEV